jgi:hypothetical protein
MSQKDGRPQHHETWQDPSARPPMDQVRRKWTAPQVRLFDLYDKTADGKIGPNSDTTSPPGAS